MKKHSNLNGSDGLRPEWKTTRNDREGKKVIRFRPKDTPGVICIERQIRDEAVVISGSLILKHDAEDLGAWIEEGISAAAREVRDRGGLVDQIKAAFTVTSTSVIAVSDEKPMEKEPPRKDVRIVIAAIMYKVEPREAEDIVRNSLAMVRSRLREQNNGAGK